MRCSPPSLAYHNSEEEEPDEISVVVLSHTVCHEGAVVVEPEDALAARVAVLGPRNLRKKRAGDATRFREGGIHYSSISGRWQGQVKGSGRGQQTNHNRGLIFAIRALWLHKRSFGGEIHRTHAQIRRTIAIAPGRPCTAMGRSIHHSKKYRNINSESARNVGATGARIHLPFRRYTSCTAFRC